MKGARKGNRLFFTWLAIQISFLVLMNAVTLGIYFYTNHHIKRQLDELHMANLQRSAEEAGSLFDSVLETAKEYAINPRVTTLAGTSLNENERDVAGLVDDIKQTNSTAKGVGEIIISLDGGQFFISSAGAMDKSIFDEVYYSRNYDEKYSLSEVMSGAGEEGMPVAVYNGRSAEETVAYIKKSAGGILICAVADKKQIISMLEMNLQSNLNALCIMDSGGNRLFSAGNLDDGLIAALSGENISQYQKIKTNSSQMIAITQNKDGLRYISLIDRDNYLAESLGIQRTAIIIFSVSLVLGAAAAYYITKYKYKPVENVINISKAITPEYVFSSNENELSQIKNAIEFINSQKELAKSTLDEHSVYIANNAFKMMLDGDARYNEMSAYVRNLTNISEKSPYTVAVMDVKNLGAIDAISKVRPNLSEAKHIMPKGGRVIFIFEKRSDEALKILNAKLMCELDCAVAVGVHSFGFKGIKTSYDSALIGLSTKILPGTAKIIPPLNKKEAEAITISTEDEIRLGGYIRSGEADKACAMLDRLVNRRGAEKADYFSFKTYLFNISNIIVRSAESVLSEAGLQKLLGRFSDAFAEEDYSLITGALSQAVAETAGKYSEKMASSNKRMNSNVVLFIENKISDSQLSSDMIAEAMNINSAYLRRFFKEQNGITLWDFINMKRIESARAYLVNTPQSIKAVASACGYVSISTFIRTFKKFTGMTPGHYRSLYK